jgi:hypothetical protein
MMGGWTGMCSSELKAEKSGVSQLSAGFGVVVGLRRAS